MGCGPAPPSITLHKAVEQGDLQAVQQHIAAKTDVNQTDMLGRTPLHIAARKGDLAIVQALTAAGADVNRRGMGNKTPVDLARENRHPAIVQLLQQRAPTQTGGRPLMDGGVGVSEVLDIQ